LEEQRPPRQFIEFSKEVQVEIGVFFAFQYSFASSHPGRKTYKVRYPAFRHPPLSSLNARARSLSYVAIFGLLLAATGYFESLVVVG
jgi:hypothetical protein